MIFVDMAYDVFQIKTDLMSGAHFTAAEGSWDGTKLTIAASNCPLADGAGGELIFAKKVFTVTGWSHASDVPSKIERPATQIKQDFVQKLKLTKYKRNGPCTFSK